MNFPLADGRQQAVASCALARNPTRTICE